MLFLGLASDYGLQLRGAPASRPCKICIRARETPPSWVAKQGFSRHVLRLLDSQQVENGGGNREQWYGLLIYLMRPGRVANPEHSVGMVHAALAPLQRVEQVKEGNASAGILNPQHGLFRKGVMDGATGEHSTAIALGVEGPLFPHPQGCELGLRVGSIGNAVQAQPELLCHHWFDATGTGDPGEFNERKEILRTIVTFSTCLFVP